VSWSVPELDAPKDAGERRGFKKPFPEFGTLYGDAIVTLLTQTPTFQVMNAPASWYAVAAQTLVFIDAPFPKSSLC
jgi:hypothetical protein